MNKKLNLALCLSIVCLAFGEAASFGASFLLEGLNKGDTNTWVTGNLMGWQELDYIPCRVNIAGSVNNQTITLNFPHLSGTTPGFENLYNFGTTGGVTFISSPVLTPSSSGTWTYTFIVKATSSGTVTFRTRLAAGAHINPGSSLQIDGSPQSMGQLQIHKPQPGQGAPNLAVVKTGPVFVPAGGSALYTLAYTNQATGTNTGIGVQICDILPPQVTINTNLLPANAHYAGNTIFFDLPDLAPLAGGQVTFQAEVPPSTPVNTVLTNFAQIFSSQNDADDSDNQSQWLTTVQSAATCPTCIVSYPYASTNPLTSISFSESEILRAYNPTVTGITDTIRLWYNDEHALTLGIRRVIVKTKVGTSTVSTTNDYPITAMAANPGGATNVAVGTTLLSGDQSAVDVTNRPLFPALFVTDTTQDSTSRSGDWQFGGTPVPPSAIFGTWKSGIKTVDNTGPTPKVTIALDGDPTKNDWNLGNGDPAPAGLLDEGYGCEVRWNVADLKLLPGHSYRLYFMVHDGDQNRVGGDAGQGCVNICVPCMPLAATPLTNQSVCAGSTAVFSTTVIGGTGPYAYPFTFQWYKDAVALGGQTNSTLVLSNVNTNNSGTYTVIVTGSCGSPVTNSAILTVSQGATIVTPPANAAVCPNSPVSFSVNATGSGLVYQWYKGATPLNGATNSTLTLNNATSTDAGIYSVVVNDMCGTPVTNSATLTLNSNVVVVTPPSDATVCPGSTANFSVNATGTGLMYQWYKATSLLGGKTGSTLTLNGVSPTDAGAYSVVVGGTCGNFVTNSATLFVNANVVIATPPANSTNCPGTTANFSVNADGSGLSYQWYKGASLLNQTGNTLTLSNVSVADAGVYTVVVSGMCGSPVTNSATLVISTNAVVTTPPSNTTNCPGTTANFSVNAIGSGLAYQWYRGAILIGGQTNSTLTLTNVSAADAGPYRVVINGACGLPITNSATLVVNSNVVVTIPPANSTNCVGTTAFFSVSASGTDLNYQWYKGANLLGGQIADTLTLTNVTSTSGGIYSVVVSGGCGSAATNSALLLVNSPTVITNGLSNVTNCPGTSVAFAVGAGGGDLVFRWYKDGSLLLNQTNPDLHLDNITAADAGVYSIVVNGACGASLTNSATLVVNTNALVVTPPSNSTNCPGTTANFSVNAIGTGLAYQWYKGTGLLAGKTNNTLTLANVGALDAGSYNVTVSGVCGVPITNSATLVVNSNVVVTIPPSDTTVCSGATANFSVGASGTDLNYQWYKGTSLLSDQIGNTLTLSNVTSTGAGTYRVVVSGDCGSPMTNSASLFVNIPTAITNGLGNVTNCPGSTVIFAVGAMGKDLIFQWYKGVSPLLNQTNMFVRLDNIAAADAGMYSVVVNGECGTSVTNSAVLVVNTNALVTIPPSDSTVCPGTTANFSVTATGTGLTYQWYKGTSLLNGQTGSLLSLTNASAADAGKYSVVVTGICGTPVTNSATLTVNSNLVVTVPPVNSTNCPGTATFFNVTATGSGLMYQWYNHDSGTNLGGILVNQTNSSLVISNINGASAGTYRVVVTGACGGAVTNSATLTVNTEPLISVPPTNAVVCPGANANFSVNATGTGLAYQWYKTTSLLPGKTNNTLMLANVSAADAGNYNVVIVGACGAPITNGAALVVHTNALVTTPPSDATACLGFTANFSVNAFGTGLTYQWYKGTSLLNGQTGSTLSLTNVSAADAGSYSVVVSGICGTPLTNSATLMVNSNVVVSVPPANSTNCPGTTAFFSVNATGSGLTYQWYAGGSATNLGSTLNGETSSILGVSNVTSQSSGVYQVVIQGACGGAATNSAILVVDQNVSMTPLASVTNNIGSSVTFTAVPSGTGPFSYQWFKGTTALTGQTNSTLTLGNLQPGDSGTYSVSVTGVCGQAAASAAVLTVNLPPVVSITYPTNGTIFVEPATFTILASASDPDGVVTNVEFFSSTNGVDFVPMGETNNTPYLTIASNLPAAHYTFVARATDNLGATGISAPVNVDVVPVSSPEITVVGNLTLNTQDGFQWLTNVVCNPLYSHPNALRIDIHNITNSAIRVVNANGTNNGVPFVISSGAIMPGDCWTNVIKFYDPLQLAFFPMLTVQLVDPIGVGEPDGTPQPIFSGKFLRDGTFLVEFTTVPGATYYVQYSSDMVHWKTAFPPLAGTGQHTQFIDSGPPATESLPSTLVKRFYRVLVTN